MINICYYLLFVRMKRLCNEQAIDLQCAFFLQYVRQCLKAVASGNEVVDKDYSFILDIGILEEVKGVVVIRVIVPFPIHGFIRDGMDVCG